MIKKAKKVKKSSGGNAKNLKVEGSKKKESKKAIGGIDFKKKIEELLVKWGVEVGMIGLETPPDSKLGDYAFPCFGLAKTMKKNPLDIAREIAYDLKGVDFLEKVEMAGPYVNFFIKKDKLAESVIGNVLGLKEVYGSKGGSKGEKIMMEMVEPNTNKPLHLGHLRNAFLGMSVSNTLEFIGNKVIRVNLVNDRGVHICKSMLAYAKWGGEKTPESEGMKSDHFVGDYYVMFSRKAKDDAKLEDEAQEMLKKWEEGDKEIVGLWRRMNKWAIEGMNKTYDKIGLKYDKEYYESQLYKFGKEIVLNGAGRGIFKKDEDGSVYADLSELGKKVLLRGDGTAIYITQDIYLAKLKFEQYKMDRSVYVVGNEQDYHFKVLFKILKMLGFEYADKCYHLSYGMVNLPEGKMKSREGQVVDADDIIDEVVGMAKDEVRGRWKELNAKEVDRRAKAIGMAGLRFYLLRIDPKKDMVYNPIDSISFEGDTGPYVQYTYARIMSILKKVKGKGKVDFGELKEEVEMELVKDVGRFGEVVLMSGREYKPNLICNYLLEVCHNFNTFYSQCPVVKAEDGVRRVRIELLKAVAQVLESGLGLLNIDVLKEM